MELPTATDRQRELARGWGGQATAEELARRCAFLSEASRLLAHSLEVETILDQVAHSCVPMWADWCSFHLLDDRRQIRLAAVAAHDLQQQAWARSFVGVRHPLVDPSGIATVIDGARSVALDHAPEAFLQNVVPPTRQAEVAAHLAVRSLVCAPIAARGCCFGALLLAQCESGRQLGAADRALAEELALRSAIAVDNAMLYQAAKQAVRVRDELIAVASHELRTPVTVMTLALDRLLKKASSGTAISSEELVQSGKTLQSAVHRLSDLIESLLDTRHIGDIGSNLAIQQMDLAEVVREVVEHFEPAAERAGCALTVRGAESPVWGRWDRIRVNQVLTNLLANAFKYGRGKPIEVTLTRDRSTATVTVRDHGIGIAVVDLERIFEPFERAAPLTNFGGFALGLYITRQIVEAHGGRIHVDSTPGQGATFTVDLPRQLP